MRGEDFMRNNRLKKGIAITIVVSVMHALLLLTPLDLQAKDKEYKGPKKRIAVL